jgi:hypothetical protein
MNTLFEAMSAAAHTAHGRRFRFTRPLLAAIALALSGSMPATAAQAGADPADPAAKVAPVRYRSTIAPYTGLRPAMPAPWRERNDSVSPRPKPAGRNAP